MFTKKSKTADSWKENPLNGPPDQRENEFGKIETKIRQIWNDNKANMKW